MDAAVGRSYPLPTNFFKVGYTRTPDEVAAENRTAGRERQAQGEPQRALRGFS